MFDICNKDKIEVISDLKFYICPFWNVKSIILQLFYLEFAVFLFRLNWIMYFMQ